MSIGNMLYNGIISTDNLFIYISNNYTLPSISFSEIVFIIFFSFVFLFGFFIIFSKDSIYCLLALIFVYVLGSILVLSYYLEFLAFALIIVSLGAVAVLFLYVVLMVNLKGVRLRESMFYNFNISSFLLSLVSLVTVLYLSRVYIDATYIIETFRASMSSKTLVYYEYINCLDVALSSFNTPLKLYGLILYDKFFIIFILIGALLLAALIGCILLTYEYIFDKKE